MRMMIATCVRNILLRPCDWGFFLGRRAARASGVEVNPYAPPSELDLVGTGPESGGWELRDWTLRVKREWWSCSWSSGSAAIP
jgi:hypothetical protein